MVFTVGVILDGTGPFGHGIRGLCVGVGVSLKHGPDTWLSPCASGRCRKIVSASVQAATIACPKCHSKPIVPLFDPARGYEDDEAFPSCQASEPLMQEAFACPTCGKRSLRISFAGLWD
jgi:predicted RNA-binding Zn-ribbon protein involved in translation (DUF1610 family)